MYHKRALRREETLSLEMYHFQPPKNSSWHLHHLPLGAKTHLRKAISTAHSQLDGSTLDHFLYNLRKHGFQFVFARYLQRHLCIHIKKHVFLIVHNTSTPTKKKQTSVIFNIVQTSHYISSSPKKNGGNFPLPLHPLVPFPRPCCRPPISKLLPWDEMEQPGSLNSKR